MIQNFIPMLTFQIQFPLSFGEAVYVCGNSKELGHWNPMQAKRMQWSEGDIWKSRVEINMTGQEVQDFEYKYFYAEFDRPINIEWEMGPNRIVRTNENTIITDVWNHRKILFQCYNPKKYPVFVSGSCYDLGMFKRRVSMKQKEDVSYLRILVNILEEREIRYQFHFIKKSHYASPLQTMTLTNTSAYYKNYLVVFCEGLNQIKRSIYQLDNHICYGYVPTDQNDFNSLKKANLNTIIEFQNSQEQSNNSIKKEDFTYFTVNICAKYDSNYFQRLYSFIQLLIQKYNIIYICNNSLKHLRKYLQIDLNYYFFINYLINQPNHDLLSYLIQKDPSIIEFIIKFLIDLIRININNKFSDISDSFI
ncbi:unnamed protein product [Paramecium sonneborni]|uniref:CBM20 domain-containing protein n=1 Tax=Paramecium sonneborni TaxID=65129 RepID=A0A8S1RFN1_9CILI|nr:unnamed protein product [Paramecium sonneborni]